MTGRVVSWLAWSLFCLSLVMAFASIALSIITQSTGVPGAESGVGDLLVFVTFLAFPIVGVLIASRRPENWIGWICLVTGLLWMLIYLVDIYSSYGVAVPGSVPFPVTIYALLFSWIWVPAVGLVGIYTVLLFPDGRLPSRRWRLLAWVAGAAIVVESVAVFLTPGPLMDLGGARNPFGLEEYPWVEVVETVAFPLLPLCMLASAASLVLRYRRSGTEVREQIKWLAFAGSFVGLIYLGIEIGNLIDHLVSSPGTSNELSKLSWWGPLLENVMLLSFAGVPLAIGFAILKHRLYDIDIVINRTLVYGPLTVTLVALYFGGIVVLQLLFVVITGQKSTLAVVASTLLIAALFNPLRRRIQEFIDRRFYRRKYDARKILETFSARLRDETDLAMLKDELLGVASETMQPEYVSLWLRQPSGNLEQAEEEL